MNIEWLPLSDKEKTYLDWVCSMHAFLKDLGLRHYCEYDKIGILYVNDDLKEIVLKKCIELGVLFRIHCLQTAVYEGYHLGEKKFIGFMDNGVDFFIESVPKGVDNTKIVYTMERRM